MRQGKQLGTMQLGLAPRHELGVNIRPAQVALSQDFRRLCVS